MFCQNCGKQIQDGTKYCDGCGAQINTSFTPILGSEGPEKGQNTNPIPEQSNTITNSPVQNDIGNNIIIPTPPRKKRLTWIILGVAFAILLLFLLGRCASSSNTSTQNLLSEENTQLKDKISELEDTVNDLNSEKETLEKTIRDLNSQIDELNGTVNDLNSQIDEYKNGAASLLIDIKNAYEQEDWQTAVDKATTLHSKFNGSPEDQEAQTIAVEAQQKLDEAAEIAAAEEAAGYETGITYDQLARTPDDFKGKKVKFSGKVVQVIEGDGETDLRIAVSGDYDTILYAAYDSSIVSSRVLEDDYITIYGVFWGNYSYQSTFGGQITIPAVLVDRIDQ